MALTIAERMAAGRQQQPRQIQSISGGNAAKTISTDSRSAKQIAEQHEQEASEFRERFRNFNWGNGKSF